MSLYRPSRPREHRPAWRELELKFAPGFQTWLQQNCAELNGLSILGGTMLRFISGWFFGDDEDAPRRRSRFLEQLIPTAKTCDAVHYDDAETAAAYAFQHLLERYRRTWRVLDGLLTRAALPLGTYGVNLLDVGTGPAPTVYAIQDFYACLAEYAADSRASYTAVCRQAYDR
jgi:hypothetical protein